MVSGLGKLMKLGICTLFDGSPQFKRQKPSCGIIEDLLFHVELESPEVGLTSDGTGS